MVRFRLLFLLFILLATHSCKQDGSSSNDSDSFDKDTSGFAQLETELKDVYYRFPSPGEMFRFIDSSGLQFDNTLLLPVKNADNYLDSKSQAVNLGIYVADLAYITLFQRYKESMDYLHVIYILSEKIRISSAFNKNLVIRIESNIQNLDSLKVISDNALTSLINYLVRNNKENTFAIISMGGFVESLYLSLNLVSSYSSENPTIQRIIDQKIAFDNLIRYSNEYSDDPNVRSILEIAEPLTEFFNKITFIEKKTKVSKAEDGRIIIGGGKQLKINEEEFYEFKTVVTKTRKNFIQIYQN